MENDRQAINGEQDAAPTTKSEIVLEGHMRPMMAESVTIRDDEEEDGQYILFNAEKEVILVINATGKYILQSCTGAKNISQIIADIKKEYQANEQEVDLDAVVKNYLEILLKGQLIEIKNEVG